MQSKATTVEAYLGGLDPQRQGVIQAVRKIILANIDPDFQEQMQYGMIGYSVPHSIYPDGYHCDPKQPLPFAGLASQKNHISLYLCSAYNDIEFDRWIRMEFEKAGKKLDMGKCCIRFKKLEDLPLGVVAEAFRRVRCSAFVQSYEAFLKEYKSIRPAAKKSIAKTADVKGGSKKAVSNKASGGKRSSSAAKSKQRVPSKAGKKNSKVGKKTAKKKVKAKRLPK